MILAFISHMVQIIPSNVSNIEDTFLVFISHMVQIIRRFAKELAGLAKDFISHMVQIIPASNPKIVFLGVATLYPTWFR